MASRYGRNKRRKDREKIALLEEAVEINKERVHLSSARARDLEDRIRGWNEDTIFLMGKFSAFLSKPGQIVVERLMDRIMPYSRVGPCPPLDAFEGAMASTTFVRDEILNTFHCMCTEDLNSFATLVRFWQVNHGTGERVYTVGQSIAEMVPQLATVDHRELSLHIADSIMAYWKANRGQQRR